MSIYGEDFYFLASNVMFVPSIEQKIIPPFIMREADLEVNDKVNIHYNRLSKDNHIIIHTENGLHIKFAIE